MKYLLSLGSNLGQRRQNLARALAALEEADVRVRRVSSVYRTQPVDFASQPQFFNLAATVETPLQPVEFLRLVKRIEKKLGRIRRQKAGPRTIDIDILLAEDLILLTSRLKIPHPRLERRNFVLFPLAEIAPNAVHPVLRKRIHSLLKASSDRSAVIKLRPFDLPRAAQKKRST